MKFKKGRLERDVLFRSAGVTVLGTVLIVVLLAVLLGILVLILVLVIHSKSSVFFPAAMPLS